MKNYTRYSRAPEIKNRKDRKIYRLLEIFPGAFSWFTLIIVIVLSWLKPSWMAIFVIIFVTYYFFRTLYLSFHLTSSYRKMREFEKINWLGKLGSLFGRHVTWRGISYRMLAGGKIRVARREGQTARPLAEEHESRQQPTAASRRLTSYKKAG